MVECGHEMHVIKLSNKSTYAIITSSFTGGLNRAVDTDSLKWAYSNQTADYFEENGDSFANKFTVLKNGTYTKCQVA
ncbi:hypothetical protein P261_00317 [Lachnospiraceae bacterium TWA4]|nr:hypothetical protein P261_00317 [Lachnospiraceae bacterium TWA4]